MAILVCEHCAVPLLGRQRRFCSLRHFYASRRIAPHVCPGCRTSYAPIRSRQVYCSPPCVPAPTPPPAQPYTARIILELLRCQGEWWLTIADMAILVYGDDSPADRHAVRCVLHRLRRSHRIDTRHATWEPISTGQPLAYRLAQMPVAQGRAA